MINVELITGVEIFKKKKRFTKYWATLSNDQSGFVDSNDSIVAFSLKTITRIILSRPPQEPPLPSATEFFLNFFSLSTRCFRTRLSSNRFCVHSERLKTKRQQYTRTSQLTRGIRDQSNPPRMTTWVDV